MHSELRESKKKHPKNFVISYININSLRYKFDSIKELSSRQMFSKCSDSKFGFLLDGMSDFIKDKIPPPFLVLSRLCTVYLSVSFHWYRTIGQTLLLNDYEFS
jgi:hypothetical protein